MSKLVSQKEALETAIDVTRRLLESTKNSDAQQSIEQALMYLGQVRSHLQEDSIPEYDNILFMNVKGKQVKL